MSENLSLDFDATETTASPTGPVTALGLTFENDQARRAHFIGLLQEKLQDPEFRKIEGFPIGADEDILALSDPPYYTACPNPWIADFIAEWEAQKPEQPEGYNYHREPFAADVSEGKNDPIYNAHSYHTKVPHKAIMRYILHYTQPGDIVFDGFCGTGMTGVAAQLCGNRETLMSLGYQVKPDGTILQEETDENGQNVWKPFFKLGVRRAVLNDLSPAATFIAYNYNTPVDVATFEQEAKRILKKVEDECGWIYETLHTDGKTKGKINYTVWSEVFNCPHCGKEVIFFDDAVDHETFAVNENFHCPHCAAELDKKSLQRQWQSYFDAPRNETHRLVRYAPVLINYQMGKYRYEKKPDEADLSLLRQIEDTAIQNWFPTFEMPGAYGQTAITCQSTTNIGGLPTSSLDYIFIDPPFGNNLHYSELNFFWEAWLKVLTQRMPEAVMDKGRNRTLHDYQVLMSAAFQELHRALKSGRWVTIEFHNSSNSVWVAIQEALELAGFVVADVRTLDKQQETYKQSIQKLVKQDLVISAYKPNGGLEDRFMLEAGTEEGVWDFVRTHLKQLPVFVSKDRQLEVIPERMNYLLFDRMIAFHVRRGVLVPMNSADFYAGLEQRFSVREEMYFLPDQAVEFDKKRITVTGIQQFSLFVTDEASAIQWLRQLIKEKPQSTSDINPQFMKQLGGYSKNEKMLELSTLLEQNFLCFDGKGPVPNQIHSYLSSNWQEMRRLESDSTALISKAKDRWYAPDPNKAGDLEKLREKALFKEFEEYVGLANSQPTKKLKVFRLEAVRAGFKRAWQVRDYATIVAVANKIPNNVLEEDPKLLMWYDQAVTRMGGV